MLNSKLQEDISAYKVMISNIDVIKYLNNFIPNMSLVLSSSIIILLSILITSFLHLLSVCFDMQVEE